MSVGSGSLVLTPVNMKQGGFPKKGTFFARLPFQPMRMCSNGPPSVRDTYKETRGIQGMDTMDTGVEVHQVGHIEKATNTCVQLTDEGKK